jgi:hypothetical protein
MMEEGMSLIKKIRQLAHDKNSARVKSVRKGLGYDKKACIGNDYPSVFVGHQMPKAVGLGLAGVAYTALAALPYWLPLLAGRRKRRRRFSPESY